MAKARDLLGFEATVTLDQMLDELIPWVRHALEGGLLTVDLSGLDSCDTECVRLLITLTKRARIAEGDLVLTSPSAGVLQALTKVAAPDHSKVTATP